MTVLVARSAEDGRKARSEASRRAIVTAMLALVRGGNPSPGAEQVAARAKVGLRTVFRHFENMESLYREMNQAMEAEILPLARQPLGGRTWRERLSELIGRRAEIFERIMPLKIAADIHRHDSLFIAAQMTGFAAQQRAMILSVLPSAHTVHIEALDLVLSFDSWRRLRHEQNLSRTQALALMEEMASRFL
jgi:AcrR family transcriptional regulator